ncbi:MAG: hypothetical protein WBB07_23260 [Mycobacterium sp.]
MLRPPLPTFGESVDIGSMPRMSSESGITFREAAPGAGFRISRQEYALF